MITSDELRKTPRPTRDQLKETLRRPDIFENFLFTEGIIKNQHSNFACPICGSGTNTPCAALKDGRLTCFSSSHTGQNSYDFIDFIGEYKKVSGDYIDKLTAAANAAGIMPDISNNNSKNKGPESTRLKIEAVNQDNHANERTQDNSSNQDFSAYIQHCTAQALPAEAMEYLTGRGFDTDFITSWHIGYDAGRIVIPYEKTNPKYYCTRSITKKDYRKPTGTQEPIFNAATLKEPGIVFVTEGQFDALAVEASGFRAIAIGGTNGGRKLIDHVRNMDAAELSFIILFDNDRIDGNETKAKATNDKAEELRQNLEAAGHIACIYPDLLQKHKDPNDFYRDDPYGFLDVLAEAVKRTQIYPDEVRDTYFSAYSAAGRFAQFEKDINDAAKTAAIPTGFAVLDKNLDGGLRSGLYVLGAMTGAGKTAFALQMADQIAASNNDVMIFALEMSRNELMARSISRESYLNDEKNGLTIFGVLDATRYSKYSEEKFSNLLEAESRYKKYAGHVFIFEGMGEIGAVKIRADIDYHIKVTGRRPVVIVDYIQLLAPFGETRTTDKQNMDKNIMELKRISRDYNLPIIGISSMNRAAYATTGDNNGNKVKFESFKESGAIEYSSDVLLGLNHIKDQKESDADKRYMELEILKNRNGRAGGISSYWYYSKYNYYCEKMQSENAFDRAAAKVKKF